VSRVKLIAVRVKALTKKAFPARSLTAPGCNALAALRPLSLPTRGKAQLPQWLYAGVMKIRLF